MAEMAAARNQMMSLANHVLRFVLELCAVAAAAYSGSQLAAAAGAPSGIGAVAAALAFILLWAVVAAPKRQNGLSALQKERIGTAIMLGTAGGLALAGQPALAIVFGLLIVLNVVLLAVFGRDGLDHLKGVTS
jgi:hypothetical protein